MHTRPRRSFISMAAVAVLLAMALALTACSPTAPTAGPSVAPTAPVVSAPASSAPTAAPLTSQTDTAWGRIWDDLPAGFPVFPTATIADDATSEPVSGVFAIPDGDPAEVIAWMQAALETATYSTEALSGPFEDGSVTLESVGDGDCRIETVVAPMGGLSLMTIRYGAACLNT